MRERKSPARCTFQAESTKPLIGVLIADNDREVVEYFTDEEAAEAATSPTGVQRALRLLGAWQDIDADDALEQLDRIRHESEPTPPIDL